MNTRLTYILVLVAIAALCGWYLFFRTPPIQIPQTEDVIAISVSLYNRPDSGPEISDFEIPKSHHDKILNLFRDAQPDPSPFRWQVLGSVKIESEQGTYSISLFWTGELTGAFRTSRRHYYRGSSDSAILQAIDDAIADAK